VLEFRLLFVISFSGSSESFGGSRGAGDWIFTSNLHFRRVSLYVCRKG